MSKVIPLTWQDVRAIVKTHSELLNTLDYGKIQAIGEEGYYTEVLQRFVQTK